MNFSATTCWRRKNALKEALTSERNLGRILLAYFSPLLLEKKKNALKEALTTERNLGRLFLTYFSQLIEVYTLLKCYLIATGTLSATQYYVVVNDKDNLKGWWKNTRNIKLMQNILYHNLFKEKPTKFMKLKSKYKNKLWNCVNHISTTSSFEKFTHLSSSKAMHGLF